MVTSSAEKVIMLLPTVVQREVVHMHGLRGRDLEMVRVESHTANANNVGNTNSMESSAKAVFGFSGDKILCIER